MEKETYMCHQIMIEKLLQSVCESESLDQARNINGMPKRHQRGISQFAASIQGF